MWTGIKIFFGANCVRIAHGARHFKQSPAAQAFFAKAEMHWLQACGDRSHDAKAIVNNVRRRQVGIEHATPGGDQGVDARIQIIGDAPS